VGFAGDTERANINVIAPGGENRTRKRPDCKRPEILRLLVLAESMDSWFFLSFSSLGCLLGSCGSGREEEPNEESPPPDPRSVEM
jgi:hypothetical protein